MWGLYVWSLCCDVVRSFFSSFTIIWLKKSELDALLSVLGCLYSVSLPRGAMGCSVVCGCAIP